MKYVLDLGETLCDEVRRIAAGRLNAAANLLVERPKGLDEAIHDARRHLKQCRSLYRLVASEAGEFQHVQNGRLGDIGRRLSALRDAKALVEVAHYLRREIPTKSNAILMDRLGKRLEQRRMAVTHEDAAVADAVASAENDLRKAADDAARIVLPTSRRKAAICVARGWENVGRKCRQALRQVAAEHDEAFHELRKRAQDRWMQAALLQALWPTAMVSISGQTKYLSDLLGHAQDLAVLLDTVSSSRELVGDTVEAEAIRETVLTQQASLKKQARSHAALLFRKAKPRDGEIIGRLLLEHW